MNKLCIGDLIYNNNGYVGIITKAFKEDMVETISIYWVWENSSRIINHRYNDVERYIRVKSWFIQPVKNI